VPGIHGAVYRVMYVSTSLTNRPVPVTGLVIVPRRRPPRGGYPVVAWAHGTNGMTEQCAPSLEPASAVPLANELVDRGWLVVATDYRGEGTPGLMPYLVGMTAARDVIDIVRAAHHLPVAHPSTRFVVWGHSEGGQAALFALQEASRYGRGLQLSGVVAGAPFSPSRPIIEFVGGTPFRYYLVMAAVGLHRAYGARRAPLDDALTANGQLLLPVAKGSCAAAIARRSGEMPIGEPLVKDSLSAPTWRKVLDANDPEHIAHANSVPLLLIQGGADAQVPPLVTVALADHLCRLGQRLEQWTYPATSHSGVILASADDMIGWIGRRLESRRSRALPQESNATSPLVIRPATARCAASALVSGEPSGSDGG
jgi:alpha-beta hydrolase superfamily lysophospholipase